MAKPIFDPIDGPRWVLNGRIVPMTGPDDTIDDGNVYISGGLIEAVQPADQPPPIDFDGLTPLKTGGTIFPGFVELHNHLAYNVLPLWQVPKSYRHRGQWGQHPDYRKLISGPMNVLGRTDGLVQAVVRWTEAKALIAGTTTSQGIALYSNAGIAKYYRGLVRNVEETSDSQLPEAQTRIGDVEANSAAKFLRRLESQANRNRTLILHLAEGRSDDKPEDTANRHFRALKIDSRTWAINRALIGVHCTGLRGRNFATMGTRRASIVWSPLSNPLLYGATTDIGRALDDGVPVALGSDWSPSGSKNLLMELKVARLHCDAKGINVSDYELVKMVTVTPAAMIGWNSQIGMISPGHRSDFVVLSGTSGDPYHQLLAATESNIGLVIINGVRRYGEARLMGGLDGLETRKVGGLSRQLNLRQDNIEQSVADLSLGQAEERLIDALERLPELALSLEHGSPAPVMARASGRAQVRVGTGATMPTMPTDGSWFLDLDHESGGGTQRPKLMLDGLRTGVFPSPMAAGVPLSELLEPIALDEMAAVDDDTFWSTFGGEQNLPEPIRAGMFPFYGRRAPATSMGPPG
jgi:5-methylthioadenosine/S-adenosylhomocysteine deaminase